MTTPASTASTPPPAPPAMPPQVKVAEPSPPRGEMPARLGIWRAMVFKEARELAPWAALGAAGLGLLLFLNVFGASHSQSTAEPSALNDPFFVIGTIAPACVAALLGFVQFFRDSRPDHFALLTHRPASRSLLFCCKIAVAVVLYALAMAVPYVLAMVWASDPRHIPLPFSWSMALAPLADIVAGLPYYAAAILVATRKDARWLGSRVLPLGLPLVVSVLNYASLSIGFSLLAIVPAIAILGVPAWATFGAAGQSRPQPVLAKIPLAFALLIGTCIAGGACIGLLDAFVGDRNNLSRQYLPIPDRGEILLDGTPVLIDYNVNPNIVKDLRGNVITTIMTNDGTKFVALPQLQRGVSRQFDAYGFHTPLSYFAGAFTENLSDTWYQPRSGDYLVGYDMRTRRLIGALGPDGLAPDVAVPPKRFAEPPIVLNTVTGGNGSYSHVLIVGDTVYRIGPSYKYQPLFTTPDDARVTRATMIGASHYDSNRLITTYPYIALATDRSVIFLTNEDKPAIAAQWHAASAGQIPNVVGHLPQLNQFVVGLEPAAHRQDIQPVVFVNADGSVAKTVDLPGRGVIWRRSSYADGPLNVIEQVIGPFIAPPALMLLADAIDWHNIPEEYRVPENRLYTGRLMRINMYGAIVGAIITFFLARRRFMSFAAALGWAIAALPMGIAGVFVMLFVSQRPIVTQCPQCSGRRSVFAVKCPRCGAAFGAPAATGAEIFA